MIELTNVDIQMSRYRSNSDNNGFAIRFEDRTSGRMIAEARVPDDQLGEFFGTGPAKSTLKLYAVDEDSEYGRKLTVTHEPVPNEVLQGVTGREGDSYWPYEMDGVGPVTDAARAWAETQRIVLGAHSASVRIGHGKATVYFDFLGEPVGRK